MTTMCCRAPLAGGGVVVIELELDPPPQDASTAAKNIALSPCDILATGDIAICKILRSELLKCFQAPDCGASPIRTRRVRSFLSQTRLRRFSLGGARVLLRIDGHKVAVGRSGASKWSLISDLYRFGFLTNFRSKCLILQRCQINFDIG